MRKIGQIDGEVKARMFADYLYARGISGELEGDAGGSVNVWVHDEDRLAEAEAELQAFKNNQDDIKYLEAASKADDLRYAAEKDARKYARKIHGRESITNAGLWSVAPLTFVLIAISVVVTIFACLGSDSKLAHFLVITAYSTKTQLVEVMHGQVWRLITPVFMHTSLMGGGFGFLHLLFNMMWLKDLGQMLERAEGSRGMLVKFLVLAVLTNLGQFIVSGPAFGGMSGVVFGLLGYCWIRGKFDSNSGLYVHQQTATFMIFWFFICLSGLLGPIANTARGVGLVVGIAWGWISARIATSR
jgi:GlpG protein